MKTKRFVLLLALMLVIACSACAEIIDDPVLLTRESDLPDELFSETPPEVTEAITTNLQVHFIDVGQGDSILIQLPNGQTMLIDGGKQSEGDRLLEYLTSMKVTTIDFLIATHPHEDHIGGLPAVIEELNVRNIYMPRVAHNTRIFEDLLLAIGDKGLTINTAKAGVDIVSVPDLQISFVAPVDDYYEDLNNYSGIIRLTYKDNAFLFTGDAEAKSEKQITADISANVLKAGHHGSNTSTTSGFLKKVDPEIAVISCGKDNSYGHPHDEIMDRLNRAGVKVYRTDERGTVRITSDGVRVDVVTEK